MDMPVSEIKTMADISGNLAKKTGFNQLGKVVSRKTGIFNWEKWYFSWEKNNKSVLRTEIT